MYIHSCWKRFKNSSLGEEMSPIKQFKSLSVSEWMTNEQQRQCKQKWRKSGGESPPQCLQAGGHGELTKKGNRHWHHLLRDQNKTNVAERIITALVKTGKPEMVWDNSALDMCSACWWLDTRVKEDIQWAAGEQWLPTKDDNQEVQSHGNERRKVPRSSYQQCLMLLKKDSEEKFSHRKKASPSAKASQKAQAMRRWKSF